MGSRFLVDSNVLVYAYDRSEIEKQEIALNVLDRLVLAGTGVLSSQILAEFFVVSTLKLAKPLSISDGHKRVKSYLRIWPVVNVTGIVVLEAVRGVREFKFSYWDAQIWATARMNQVPVVLSEDFNEGSEVEGIRFINPFSESFDIGILG